MKTLRDILIVFALFLIAAAAKACMDTIVFHPTDGFASWPLWAHNWMMSHGTTYWTKLTDGWHVMQMVMFLCTVIASALAGWRGRLLRLSQIRVLVKWWHVLVVLWAIRLVAQAIGFELLYPIL